MTLPAIDSSVTAEEAHRLQQLAKGARVLEVGSWRGFSTVALAQVAEVVHAVDWHRGDEHAGHDESLGPLMENLDRYEVRDRVVVHVGRSEAVLPLFPAEWFDLAFIDAFHATDAVIADAELVMPLVHRRGHIAFHDYGDPRFGVTEAVDGLKGVKWISLTGSLAVVQVR